jgi:hypothetical protein
MEKVLIAVDSQYLNQNVVRFGCYLSNLTRSPLVGIFLEKPEVEAEVIYNQIDEDLYSETLNIRDTTVEENTLICRQKNIDLFRELAWQENTGATIHLDKGVPLSELLDETRYADLLIIDAAISFSGMADDSPTTFVKNVLHDARCPVVIAPDNFEGIESIIFCYDRTISAFFAMKQFSYLFPVLKSKSIKVFCLHQQEELTSAEMRKVTEWLSYHYNNDVEWIIPADASEVLFDYLVERKNDFVVMGAYGKGLLTSFFTGDQEDEDIGTTAVPIFVSHF